MRLRGSSLAGSCCKALRGEKRLNDAGLHIEDAGAIGFAGGDAERAFFAACH